MLSYVTLSVEYSSLEFEIMLLKQSSPMWAGWWVSVLVCVEKITLSGKERFFFLQKLELGYVRYFTEKVLVNLKALFCLAVRL